MTTIADLIPHGRRPKEPGFEAEVIRPLTAADIMYLGVQGEGAAPLPAHTNIRLRSIHHSVARLVAAGKSNLEVAALTGMHPNSVARLVNHDPAFQELLAYYRDQIDVVVVDDAQRLQAKLLDVAEMAVDEITDRLSSPDKIKATPTAELRKLATMGLDRTVAPSKSAPNAAPPMVQTFTLNMGVNAERIQARARAGEPPALEATAKDITPEGGGE